MKKLLALLLAMVLALSMVACGDNKETKAEGSKSGEVFNYEMIEWLKDYAEYRYEEEFNVLYLVCTTYAEYFPNSYAVWQPMLEEYGIHMDLMGPPEYSDASLLNTLETELASQKYDLVLLYPITPQAITAQLDNIWQTYHVPVVAYAFDSSTQCGHYYMGTSYYAAGTDLGNSIVDYVNKYNDEYFKKYTKSNPMKVAVYKNAAGAEQYSRIVGAMDVLKADGRFQIIEEYEANGEQICQAQTETVLSLYPDVEVFLTQIDNDVTGTAACIDSGAFPHSDYVSVWGFDATGVVLNAMSTGGERGCVQGSSFIDHYQAGQALIEFLPIVVGAAKQGKMIDFTTEQKADLDKLLANYYKTVTPDIVSQYINKK